MPLALAGDADADVAMPLAVTGTANDTAITSTVAVTCHVPVAPTSQWHRHHGSKAAAGGPGATSKTATVATST